MSNFSANDPGRWDHAIDVLQRGGDYAHTVLLEAVRAGDIHMAFTANRTAALPWGRIRKAARPVLILVGDDDDESTGPSGWQFARKLTQWAGGAIVHGSGAEREHYEAAVRGTLICKRFLVVDTASRHAAAWAALLTHVETLIIVPRAGEHPVMQPRRTVH